MSLRKNLVRQRIVDSKEMDERQRRGQGDGAGLFPEGTVALLSKVLPCCQ